MLRRELFRLLPAVLALPFGFAVGDTTTELKHGWVSLWYLTEHASARKRHFVHFRRPREYAVSWIDDDNVTHDWRSLRVPEATSATDVLQSLLAQLEHTEDRTNADISFLAGKLTGMWDAAA